ncbi:uncharacterized protein [Drosophila bipectinata]|uniref:uncharacterized protein n=1 Tax=Drosophila bipectinata TaxID=42026 RepID=UPI001C8A6E92|nr:uncharacterized protein LOC108130403 [Drosophila bipectinata]
MEAAALPNIPNQEDANAEKVVGNNTRATAGTQTAEDWNRFKCAGEPILILEPETDPNTNPNQKEVFMVTVDTKTKKVLNFRKGIVTLNMGAGDAMMAVDRSRGRHMETHPQAHRRPTNPHLAPYICNLCAQYVRGGVITICGHLFCWICLWPNLHNSRYPKCPRCSHLLILHKDMIPFLGEGPRARSVDGQVVAQPEAVPRPTGMYLCDSKIPSWFRLNEPADVGHLGLATSNHRDLLSIPERLQTHYLGIRFEALKLFQIIFAGTMIFFWCKCLIT